MNLKSTKLLRGFSKSQGSIIRLYTHIRFSLKTLEKVRLFRYEGIIHFNLST